MIHVDAELQEKDHLLILSVYMHEARFLVVDGVIRLFGGSSFWRHAGVCSTYVVLYVYSALPERGGFDSCLQRHL